MDARSSPDVRAAGWNRAPLNGARRAECRDPIATDVRGVTAALHAARQCCVACRARWHGEREDLVERGGSATREHDSWPSLVASRSDTSPEEVRLIPDHPVERNAAAEVPARR